MNAATLVIIYNHHYPKNIERLDLIYKDKFKSIFHLIPFYSGEKSNVIPVYGNSFYFQGYIAEVLVYFNTLTTAQIRAIEGYLSWKWGLQENLPGGHPNSSVNNYQENPFPLATASILPVKYTLKRLASV